MLRSVFSCRAPGLLLPLLPRVLLFLCHRLDLPALFCMLLSASCVTAHAYGRLSCLSCVGPNCSCCYLEMVSVWYIAACYIPVGILVLVSCIKKACLRGRGSYLRRFVCWFVCLFPLSLLSFPVELNKGNKRHACIFVGDSVARRTVKRGKGTPDSRRAIIIASKHCCMVITLPFSRRCCHTILVYNPCCATASSKVLRCASPDISPKRLLANFVCNFVVPLRRMFFYYSLRLNDKRWARRHGTNMSKRCWRTGCATTPTTGTAIC